MPALVGYGVMCTVWEIARKSVVILYAVSCACVCDRYDGQFVRTEMSFE